ncbi:uncharacterized protein B0P05DRAFT_480997 [Gilbertella persicaria]|uniref:uncharacterized protein n=1 Tax=Gilbertella persicaria TaxID=101096 RepID=UPI0022209CD3|nr:uncharacterized protein B0P05DRAFT_480997 [Gilbertella persicaria]KAI8048333.1 hypothetical protein B0P05DRAFT_480997 [Gilbertella persicaria]
MGWECSCQNHVPDVPPYGWPITIAECQGKEQACINNCSSGALQNICIKGCGLYYKCKKAGSLPSGLRVSDENKIPVYNTHASEGEGSSASLLACFSCSLYTSFFIGSVVSFISALL